jgi:hypothetical protein
MSRSRANQHSHVSDPAGEAQREHPTIQCDFFFMEPGKKVQRFPWLMLVEVCGSCSSQATQCTNSWSSFGGFHFERQGWNSGVGI